MRFIKWSHTEKRLFCIRCTQNPPVKWPRKMVRTFEYSEATQGEGLLHIHFRIHCLPQKMIYKKTRERLLDCQLFQLAVSVLYHIVAFSFPSYLSWFTPLSHSEVTPSLPFCSHFFVACGCWWFLILKISPRSRPILLEEPFFVIQDGIPTYHVTDNHR